MIKITQKDLKNSKVNDKNYNSFMFLKPPKINLIDFIVSRQLYYYFIEGDLVSIDKCIGFYNSYLLQK